MLGQLDSAFKGCWLNRDRESDTLFRLRRDFGQKGQVRIARTLFCVTTGIGNHAKRRDDLLEVGLRNLYQFGHRIAGDRQGIVVISRIVDDISAIAAQGLMVLFLSIRRD